MESKKEFKKIDIKNRTCYYFNDTMRACDIDIDTDFRGILFDEKLCKEKAKNFYDISYNTIKWINTGTIKCMDLLKFFKWIY